MSDSLAHLVAILVGRIGLDGHIRGPFRGLDPFKQLSQETQ